MAFIGNGAQLTDLDAGDISSGTLGTARLSGTYNISISGNAATASNGGVTSVNGSTGAVSISAGNMSIDTNTGSSATNYALGTYIVAMGASEDANPRIALNSTYSDIRIGNYGPRQVGFAMGWSPPNGGIGISGSWRNRGQIGSVGGGYGFIYGTDGYPTAAGPCMLYLLQRVA